MIGEKLYICSYKFSTNMKKIKLIALLFIGALGMNAQTNVALNTSNTKVEWLGKKFAGKHFGLINVSAGSLDFSGNALKGGKVEIDMNSITCTDIEDAESNAGLIGHLKNQDFFDVANHPKANLEITKVQKAKKGGYVVTGNLTIKGASHSVVFPANVTNNNGKLSGKATIVFDRTKYDIKYGSTLIGAAKDKAIENNVTLTVTFQ
jgi:polyisoprenoid-binding protein YceI